MARAIGHDKLALFGAEEPVGHIDRDALLAFGSQSIDQQGEIDFRPLGAYLLAVAFKRRQLVFEDHLAVVKQAPDQRRFAVVDAAAGNEPQHRLVLVGGQIGIDVFGNQRLGHIDRIGRLGAVGHQKYPCCFFTSIPAPPASLSIARPWRSLVVVSSVSWMTSDRVAAVLSTAPVKG